MRSADDKLVQQCVAGGTDAFGALVCKYVHRSRPDGHQSGQDLEWQTREKDSGVAFEQVEHVASLFANL